MNLSGSPLDYFVAFFGGILLSLTPCVYPLIPISASYIGIGSGGTRSKGFVLSLAYVTGVAITYSVLGLIASLTGKIFGKVSSSPITYLLVGIVIIIFGLSMLDLFSIPLPRIIKLPAQKKKGYFSTFLLGLSSGLIVSPCISPVLGSIFVYLTDRKNIFYGVTLLFTFAYGMGFLLILVGTFSALLLSFPKSGQWMNYIKKFSAFILIAVGIYFIINAIRNW